MITKYEERFGRYILLNEIVFDCDNRQGLGELGIVQTGAVLQILGYNFEIWGAIGQKYIWTEDLQKYWENVVADILKLTCICRYDILSRDS